MHRRLRAVVIALTLFAALPITDAAASSRNTVVVTNARDAGAGSFRAAIDAANTNPRITIVQFRGGVRTISLRATVWFTGTQDLTIQGSGATLNGAAAAGAAFRSSGGGDLTIANLTVRNAPAEGIAVEVPTSATGTVRVVLSGVEIADNKGHGVLVNDQDDPLTAVLDGDSDASIDVAVIGTRFIRNGYSVSDRDGLRVNEGGIGDLRITSLHSQAIDNGADGIEVDERGAGDVQVYMLLSRLTGNGPFDPSDLDDGFDIDESDDGSIVGAIVLSVASDNFEEGFDFNENHAGDLRVDMTAVTASGNGEEGIDYEEDDDFAGGGDLVTTMVRITANGNGVDGGDAGVKIREKGAGNLDATIDRVEASNNLIGGISVREDADGSLVSSIARARSLANNGHGIDFDENRANAGDASGDLTVSVSRSTSSNNAGAGVRADQQTPPGAGTLLLSAVTLDANGGGATTGSNVVVTVVP